jgi:formylmethanofuran dehydrogenase subunit E
MNKLETLLNKAKEFHGDACPGIAMGTRMSIAGIEELGMNPLERNRDLVVIVEIDRCATDAVQAISGCSFGKRTLKFRDYGKFGITFMDLSSGEAVRVSALEKPRKNMNEEEMASIVDEIIKTPDEELFKIQKVQVDLPEEDVPGPPVSRTACERCGESIMDHREVIINNETVCRACADGTYYFVIED